jgi:hypothetical protein
MLRRIGCILFIKRSIPSFSSSNNDAIGAWKTIVRLIKQIALLAKQADLAGIDNRC